MQLGDLLGHLVIRKSFALEIIGQGGHFTIVSETGFVYFDQILLKHGRVLIAEQR